MTDEESTPQLVRLDRVQLIQSPENPPLKQHGNRRNDTMTPEEIKAARQALDLTQAQLGAMLDTDAQTVRRMELDPEASTFRKPAPRMVRLIRAYLDGYRPTDWPN